ncbi:hypothetical protein EHS13_09675 [Paenibacillus psychroresistens]|uniref:Extracellular solute-binding protein n=1 Tax=Paenibacillus psychroresistens TaxID=1778678 RepID=A0A6B8RHD8_9BACL|nr:hypothetical protein [Paenibacillus psychroresistens]QGQ95134.1 hypothetical protein EHS13_09675 [Paenibacillus psychroresistens]
MKFKKFSVVLSMSLAIIMSVSLIGCSKSSSTATESTKVDSSTAPAAVTSDAPAPTAAAVANDCTLKLWGFKFNQSIDSPGVQTDPVSKEIERVVGCKIELYPQESEDLFSTKLASGDMPDVMGVNRKFVQKLLDAKAVLPLDELVKQAPNVSQFDKMLNFDKEFLSDADHKLYFITRAPEDYTLNLDVGMYLRWDYYKELGSPPVNNVDDYIKVLSDMVKKHPTNDKGKKVYGLSPWFDWGMWSWTTPGYLNGMWNNGLIDYDMADNMKPLSVVTNENSSYWTTIDLFYKAKKAGILDPDSFTQKFDNSIQKGRDLQVVGGLGNFWFSDPNKVFKDAGENKGFMAIPPKEGTKARWGGYWQPLGADSHYAISSKTKYPEQAMKLYNYLYSVEGSRTINNGIKGKDWDDAGGKLTVTPEALKTIDDKDAEIKTGIRRYKDIFPGLPENFRGEYTNLFKLPEFTINNYSPLEKEYYAELGVTGAADLLQKRVENKVANTAVLLLRPLQPDDLKRIDDKIMDYMLKAAVKVVLAKDDAEYAELKQKTIEDIKGMDFDKSWKYWEGITSTISDYIAKNDLNRNPDTK